MILQLTSPLFISTRQRYSDTWVNATSIVRLIKLWYVEVEADQFIITNCFAKPEQISHSGQKTSAEASAEEVFEDIGVQDITVSDPFPKTASNGLWSCQQLNGKKMKFWSLFQLMLTLKTLNVMFFSYLEVCVLCCFLCVENVFVCLFFQSKHSKMWCKMKSRTRKLDQRTRSW